ncbi:hypothetical protein NQ176_g2017 [Zarea fungicola]|uniref:Uncharacterized protein n=1 Tax=Zarea fungicola TaxID=93591 RepID=A0ACC1NSK4_9HYPO|nr:hypothetical protein NQ176_g2017 [Lecanicillium fungicola]
MSSLSKVRELSDPGDLCELMGEHPAENMAEILQQIFKNYKIGGQIGYFTADNATLNDLYVHAVLSGLSPIYVGGTRNVVVYDALATLLTYAPGHSVLEKTAQKFCKEMNIS